MFRSNKTCKSNSGTWSYAQIQPVTFVVRDKEGEGDRDDEDVGEDEEEEDEEDEDEDED